MTKTLTETLQYIRDCGTFPPSTGEVASWFLIDAGAAHHRINRLKHAGYVTTVPGLPNAIEITAAGEAVLEEACL